MQYAEDGVGKRNGERLYTEQHPGVWYSGGLESGGVGGRSMSWDGHGGWAEVYGRVEERIGRCG